MQASRFLSFVFLVLMNHLVFGQTQWMGERVTNTAAFLDPTEVQVSGSMNGILDQNALDNQYLPFGIGISQSIASKVLEKDVSWEILGELASFTQFEWTLVDNEQQRNLINVDYRIAFSYIRQISKNTFRLRFFHVSSHLGDDYIIRNRINQYSENKVNYEQMEFTYFYDYTPKLKVYVGAGSVVRPNSIRLPFSYHGGFQFNSTEENNQWGFSFGGNIKGFQETEFRPGVKLGIGPAYFTENKPEPIRLILEYYNGHLPYSQFEEDQIEWLGLGLYFYI